MCVKVNDFLDDPFNGFTYEPSFNAESLQQRRIAMMQELINVAIPYV